MAGRFLSASRPSAPAGEPAAPSEPGESAAPVPGQSGSSAPLNGRRHPPSAPAGAVPPGAQWPGSLPGGFSAASFPIPPSGFSAGRSGAPPPVPWAHGKAPPGEPGGAQFFYFPNGPDLFVSFAKPFARFPYHRFFGMPASYHNFRGDTSVSPGFYNTVTRQKSRRNASPRRKYRYFSRTDRPVICSTAFS